MGKGLVEEERSNGGGEGSWITNTDFGLVPFPRIGWSFWCACYLSEDVNYIVLEGHVEKC